jgi:hypothetical protein
MLVQQITSSALVATPQPEPQNGHHIEAEPPENEVLASRAGKPKFANNDVRQFLWALTNGAITGAGLSVPASVFGDPDKPARRIYDATREMVLRGEEVTPSEVAAKLLSRADECDLMSDVQEWRDLARFTVETFSDRPADVRPDTPRRRFSTSQPIS